MKKSHKLSNKLIIGFVLLGVMICTASIVISYFKNRAAVGKKQNDVAYRIADVGLSYVNGDDIERYLKTGQTDEAYAVMGRYLSDLRANMNVNHLFIAELDGIELTYIFDADNPDDEFEPFQLGDKGKINAKFEEDIGRIANEGVRVDNYFYSHSEFGYNTSAIVPVYNSQNGIVAILVVEISMGILQSVLTEFVVFIAAASVLIPDSNTSVVTISKLAVKPQPTPAMAASKPATGCLPTARKISAPIGGMITNAASDEIWLKKAINSTI